MAPSIQIKDTGFTVLSEGGESPVVEYASMRWPESLQVS